MNIPMYGAIKRCTPLVNLVLSVFKLFAGIFGRSAAMLADAGHSFCAL